MLKRQGKFAEAEQGYIAALEILKSLGLEHERTRIIFTNNLALVLRDQDRLPEAEVLLRDVVKGWTNLHGLKHPDSAFGLVSLADVLWDQATETDTDRDLAKRQLDEAEQLFREALAIRQEILGDSHHDTANAMYGLGLIFSAREDYEEAERWQRKALEIRQQAFGTDERVDVLNSMNAIATIMRRQERYEEAKTMSEQSLGIAERAFGIKHYSSHRYRGALYAALWNLGDVEAIEDMIEKYTGQVSPEGHAWGLHALAEAHVTNGDVEQAIEVKRKAIDALPKEDSLRESWQRRIDELKLGKDSSG